MLYAKLATGGGVLPVFWLELPVTSVPEAGLLTRGIITGWILATGRPIELLDLRLSKHPNEVTYSLEQAQDLFLQEGATGQKDSRHVADS